MSQAVRATYDTTLRALAAAFETFTEPATLHLGTEASALFATWRAEIEPRRRPDADLGPIAAWSSKLDGAVARIAGLLHVATTFASGWDTPITVPTMATAIEVGSYLIDHATAAFGLMAADPRLDAARRIGVWIVGNNKATFTQREAFRALRGQAIFSTIEGLTAGLKALEDHGWVRGVATERGPGRPSSRYAANPSILLKGWTKRPELTKTPVQSEVLSILSMDSEPDLSDWYSAPLPQPDAARPDEWGTLG